MMKPSYLIIAIIGGIAVIGGVLVLAPATSGPYILPLIGVIALLIKQFDTDAKVEKVDTKVATVESKVDLSTEVSMHNATALAVVSQQTAQALEQVSQKVDDNTRVTETTQGTVETTHQIVNSRMDQFISKLEELAGKQKELAAAQALAQGILIGREQTDKPTDPAAAPPNKEEDRRAHS